MGACNSKQADGGSPDEQPVTSSAEAPQPKPRGSGNKGQTPPKTAAATTATPAASDGQPPATAAAQGTEPATLSTASSSPNVAVADSQQQSNGQDAAVAPSTPRATKTATATSTADLLSPSTPLPTDPAALRSLVQSLQHALASKELSLLEKEKELAAEKAQRVQSATTVLNASLKIIRPSSATSPNGLNTRGSVSSTVSPRGDSVSLGGGPGLPAGNNSLGISPSLIQLHEKQKMAAAEVASASAAAAAAAASSGNAIAQPAAASSDAAAGRPDLFRPLSLLPTPQSAADAHNAELESSAAAAAAALAMDDSQSLRRELMDVLLAFAENELIAPNASPSLRGGGGSSTSGSGGVGPLQMNNESFSNVINNSSLDDVTKLWLTAEFTRDQPRMGAATRHGRVSVVNTNRTQPTRKESWEHSNNSQSSSGSGGGPSNSRSNSNTSVSEAAGSSAAAPAMLSATAASSGILYWNQKLAESIASGGAISLSELQSWDYDPTAYSVDALIFQGLAMFDSMDLPARFGIAPGLILSFLSEISRNYIASNPYHNFQHGMDVMHCCWMYLRLTNIVPTARLRSLDILAFLISAVCHDLGHPGTNNTFQINSNSELACIYNDVSPLEHFHSASAFRVLTMPESNVLSTLTRGEWIEARKTIISCILATDMSHHFEMVSKLDTVFEKLERINQQNNAAAAAAAAAAASAAANAAAETADAATAAADGTTDASGSIATDSSAVAPAVNVHATSALPPRDESARIRANTSMLPISPSSAAISPSASSATAPADSAPLELTRDEILHLLTILLHSADISNPGKPWRVARLWGDRIQAENFNQGDLERLKGLVVSPFMDRAQENQPQTSINFGDFIVAPLMAAIVRAFPPLLPLAENLIKNRKIWHQAQLDRIAHAIRAGGLSGAALSAKEAERKSLTNKAQVFRNCFVLPMRKIAAQAQAGAGAVNAATAGASTAATPATANGSSNLSANGSAAAQNGSAAAASHGGPASSASSQQQQHQSHQHHGSIAEGEEDEADAASPLAAAASANTTAAAPAAAAQSKTITAADSAGVSSAAPSVAAAAASDAPSGIVPSAAPASSSASAPASATAAASGGGPLVRSSSASGSLDDRLERADALLHAVQSLVKRRHSMLENGTAPGSAAGGGSAANGAQKSGRQGTASLGEHLGLARVSGAGGGGALSHSQPHTPTLASLRSQQHQPLQLHAADDHAPLSPPRRASLSMAQALISSSPGLASLSVDGSLASSEAGGGELQSPMLSPDSRAVAEAISRSSSIVDRTVVTPLHSPHSAK